MSDPSGSIILLVWNSDIDPQQRQEIFTVGAALSVTGEIDEFNGQLEIVPRSLEDVVVITTAATSEAAPPTTAPVWKRRHRPRDLAEATTTPGPTKTPAATNTPKPTEEPVASGNVVPHQFDHERQRGADGDGARQSGGHCPAFRRASSLCSTTARAACS